VTDVRIAAAWTGVVVLFLGASPALAQDQDDPDRIVEAFFQSWTTAPWRAISTCPGEDALNDAIMAGLMRPRSEAETRQLSSSWSYVPECRVDQILDWSDQASRIITNRTYAASLARNVLDVDSVQGLRLLRRAAADPSVPDEARGAYQSAVYWRLSRAEQLDLWLETFRQELQVGMYRTTGMQHLFGPPDATDRVIRLLSEVLERPELDQAGYIVGAVLSSVVNLGGFGPQDRQRIWDFLEPRLESVPSEIRSAIESYEADLKAGPG
jgi:hypothetical protein